jgi:hypothetical protein
LEDLTIIWYAHSENNFLKNEMRIAEKEKLEEGMEA